MTLHKLQNKIRMTLNDMRALLVCLFSLISCKILHILKAEVNVKVSFLVFGTFSSLCPKALTVTHFLISGLLLFILLESALDVISSRKPSLTLHTDKQTERWISQPPRYSTRVLPRILYLPGSRHPTGVCTLRCLSMKLKGHRDWDLSHYRRRPVPHRDSNRH